MTDPRFLDPQGRTMFETFLPNGDVQLEPPPGQWVCDFCMRPDPKWSYPCGPVALQRVVVPEGASQLDGSNDPWAACDRCHELIEAGDLGALIGWSVQGHQEQPLAPGFFVPPRGVMVRTLRANLKAFFAARQGPAEPLRRETT